MSRRLRHRRHQSVVGMDRNTAVVVSLNQQVLFVVVPAELVKPSADDTTWEAAPFCLQLQSARRMTVRTVIIS